MIDKDLDIRQKIYSLVLNNPGLHANKIASILKISGQLADYHLFYLERKGILISIKEEGYKRYYVKDKIGSADRKRLSILRRELPLKIVFFLLDNPGSRHMDILDFAGVSKSTLSYHLKKLVDSEIIYFTVEENEKKYWVKNRDEIIGLLIKYKPFSWIDNFSDMWSGLSWD